MISRFAQEDVVKAIFVALVTGAILQPAVVALMTRRQVIDTPNERSSHTVPTPRGGGLAVVLAAAAGLAVLHHVPWATFVPLIGFAALGLADDVLGLRVRVRLPAQLLIALVSGALLAAGSDTGLPLVVAAVGTIWLTGYVNAFNFMDGVNGIAAAHAIVGGLAFTAVGLTRDLPVLIGAGPVIAAAALTFLPWNAGRARIFLGDVGSYGLGGALAALAAYALLHGAPIEAAIFPLALYLADTGWTLLRRLRAGQPLHRPHRWHTYQRLTDVGLSHTQVAFGTAAIAAVLSACGLLGPSGGTVLRVLADLVVAVVLMAYLGLPRAWRGRPRAGAGVRAEAEAGVRVGATR